MGYSQLEEITLPTRFLIITSHFIALLCVVIDLNDVVKAITNVDPDDEDLKWTAAQINDFDDTKAKVQGLALAGVACSAVEFITFFMGVTTWFPGLNLFNIVFHTAGLVLITIFYNVGWPVDTFIAFFTCFSAFPLVVELLQFLSLTRFSFLKY